MRWTLVAAALSISVFAAPVSAAELDLITNGPGTIVATIPDAGASESARVVCTKLGGDDAFHAAQCRAEYLPGRVVTLTAEPMPINGGLSSFGVWSDDRCPPAPVCDIPIDSDVQSVAASFSPQRIRVQISSSPQGPGRFTSIPAGFVCEAYPNVPHFCTAEFPLFTTVQLIAEGIGPEWRVGCDTIVQSTCSMFLDELRPADLFFAGGTLGGQGGGFFVRFRVAKDGSGSGTVRSDHLDCGGTCSESVGFGDRDTLEASPDAGSRFVAWRGACGESPRCSLKVGPVTRVTAVFERLSAAGSVPPPPPPPPPPTSGPTAASKPFVATVDRVVVRGTRKRRIRFTIRVSARASIRGVLESARGDRITAGAWRIPRGRHVLSLAVPRRAPRGTYVLRITARDAHGHVKRFDRRVRLRR